MVIKIFKEDCEARMGSSFLNLSLFIMLLSFFIVMNSVSSYETTKISPVIDSIEMAFGSKLEEEKLAKPSEAPNTIPENKSGDTLIEMEGVFAAHIKDYQLNKNRLGNVMTIDVSVEKFETVLRDIDVMRSGEEVTRSESFVPTLISLIDASQTRVPYRMDMFVQTQKDADLTNKTAKIKQAARFGQALELAGMERKLISAGVRTGEDGLMTIVFRRYEPVTIELPEEDVTAPEPQEQAAL